MTSVTQCRLALQRFTDPGEEWEKIDADNPFHSFVLPSDWQDFLVHSNVRWYENFLSRKGRDNHCSIMEQELERKEMHLRRT